MDNNEIIRCICHTFDISNIKLVAIFGLVDQQLMPERAAGWLQPEDAPSFQKLEDAELEAFLNGFIIERRGKKEGAHPIPEPRLTTNVVFRKLKIALNLQADAILEILGLAKVSMSKHELSALFRKQGHKHYRECKEQVLQDFIKGLRIKYRSAVPEPAVPPDI